MLYFVYNSWCLMQVTILLRMDDKMNRQLSCELIHGDTSFALAEELVHYGFINEVRFWCFLPVKKDKLQDQREKDYLYL